MKPINYVSAVLAVTVFITTTAYADVICRDVQTNDHINIVVKGYIGANTVPNRVYIREEINSPNHGYPYTPLLSTTGGIDSSSIAISNPLICGHHMKYSVRLKYRGDTLLNEQEIIGFNRWSSLYINKQSHTRLLIKARHKF
ncbi:MAG: hypothetical protein ACYCS8_13335 [Acidithiobacillus sp.]